MLETLLSAHIRYCAQGIGESVFKNYVTQIQSILNFRQWQFLRGYGQPIGYTRRQGMPTFYRKCYLGIKAECEDIA